MFAVGAIVVILGLFVAQRRTHVGPTPSQVLAAVIGFLVLLSTASLIFRMVQVIRAFGGTTIGAMPTHRAQDELDWPMFTVLIPLYREAASLPYIVKHMRRMDYPREQLDVRILVEEDDKEILDALERIDLEPWFTVVTCPDRSPRTKPSACNIGLEGARGKYVIIYDAEDIPEPTQLKKAVSAFRQCGPEVVCLQARLQYHNPYTNFLTQMFAAEYSFQFRTGLLGLERMGGPIPLGGTSNAFRMDALTSLGAWDPYNVTEDADLGVRIARRGWSVCMMDSVTLEEANSEIHNWYRQRSRWIKGYYQTWLVHMRSPLRLLRELGLKRFVYFQLILGYSTISGVVNPVFWGITLAYFVGKFMGESRFTAYIDSLFPPAILYLGIIGMVVGTLLAQYCLLIGSMQQGLFRSFWRLGLLPIYWLLMAAANVKAIYQLFSRKRRSYWELTKHALVVQPEDAAAGITGE